MHQGSSIYSSVENINKSRRRTTGIPSRFRFAGPRQGWQGECFRNGECVLCLFALSLMLVEQNNDCLLLLLDSYGSSCVCVNIFSELFAFFKQIVCILVACEYAGSQAGRKAPKTKRNCSGERLLRELFPFPRDHSLQLV